MQSATYIKRRGELETYFDRTAADAWAKLTSDAPVSGIRATVRAGRDAMRATLLSWLPDDLTGVRILDAGCGAGQLSCEAARRGAHVVAIDLSQTLIDLAKSRLKGESFPGAVDFQVGDMFDARLGAFDYIVSMDSLIHYGSEDIVRILDGFSTRTNQAVLFTFAPRTPLLAAMHNIGKLFPRADRAPAIQPVAEAALRQRILTSNALGLFRIMKSERIKSGFYISNAMELRR